MRKSEYMTREEIWEENVQKAVEWSDAAKAALIFVAAFLLSVAALNVAISVIFLLFGV